MADKETLAADGPAAVGAGVPRCLDVDDRPDAVRVGRRFVAAEVASLGAGAFADDAALVAAELLANARLHGSPPVIVCVSGGPDQVRIEVRDSSTRSPVRPATSTSNMTGRGLALIEALSTRWGVDRLDTGKAVWAVLSASAESSPGHDVDRILAGWEDDGGGVDERFTVVLGNVPTELLIDAKAHIDNLVREFALAAAAGQRREDAVPPHLARLIETVVHGFADARDAIKRQALAAASRGEVQTTLTLHLPLSAADAGEAYLAALDEADNYSRAARLLTLETPPDHRLFREWYVRAVVKQLRAVAAGQRPGPVRPFEDRLVAEIRRLSTAQRVSERSARLQRVTAALARARTPEDVAGVVVSEGVQALDASGGSLLVPSADGEHLAVPGAVGYGVELVTSLREERLDAALPAANALRTGLPVWLESQEERDRLYPEMRGFEAATISMCAVPLVVGARVIGALRFSFSSRKLFDDDERAFVLALAAQTAQTLQRTEVYEAERQAAIDLQRALLPVDIPRMPGWDVAAYYSPAGEQEAGGDFYDVIRVPDGRIAGVVGDVMGRGVEAAAAMSEVRSTIRAYAIDDPDPVRVFERVDAFFAAIGGDQFVTAFYFLFDAGSGTVDAVNAGHLPPLLVTESGTFTVDCPLGTPFGVGGVRRRSNKVDVPPGAALVAFTDGLVERRGEDIDDGLERLTNATRRRATTTARALVSDVITAAAADGMHDDDVTVLVLRREESA